MKHKVYGKVTIIEDLGSMVAVSLHKPHHMPHKGFVTELVVGRRGLIGMDEPNEKSLAEQYLPLAYLEASKARDIEYEEALSICSEALVKAEKSFDGSLGASFFTYATTTMRNALSTERRKMRREAALRAKVTQGVAPQTFRNGKPLSQNIGSPQEKNLLVKNLLEKFDSVLDAQQSKMLNLYFRTDLTQAQIAEELGVSQPYVAKYLTKAIKDLRENLE